MHCCIFHKCVHNLISRDDKEDDEDQEEFYDRTTYWEKSSPSEQEEVEETASIPSRDSRPPRDRSAPEVDGVTHQEDSFSTTHSFGKCPRRWCVGTSVGTL